METKGIALDSMQLVTSDDGTKRYIVQDSFSRSGMEQLGDLGIAVAIARIANARRHAAKNSPGAPVEYFCAEHDPAPALRAAVAAAGATLWTAAGEQPPPKQVDSAETIMSRSLKGIAKTFADLNEFESAAAVLGQVEQLFKKHGPDRKKNPDDYWEMVLKLGAFAGMALSEHAGGSWTLDLDGSGIDTGLVPVPADYAIDVPEGRLRVNLFSAVCDYFDGKAEEGPSQVVGGALTIRGTSPPPPAVDQPTARRKKPVVRVKSSSPPA